LDTTPSPTNTASTHSSSTLVSFTREKKRNHAQVVSGPYIPISPSLIQTLYSPTIRYQAKLAARPLLTQAVTTAILFGVGDVAAQQLVEKKGLDKHELMRTGRMALYGGGEFKPSTHHLSTHPLPKPK